MLIVSLRLRTVVVALGLLWFRVTSCGFLGLVRDFSQSLHVLLP